MKNLVKMTLFAALLAGFMAQPVEAMQAVQKTPTWKKAVYVGTGIAAVGMGIWYAYNYYYAEQPKEEKDLTTPKPNLQDTSVNNSEENQKLAITRTFGRFARKLKACIKNNTDAQTFAGDIQLICDSKTDKEIIEALQYKNEHGQTLKDLATQTQYASVINDLYTQYKVSLPENKGQGDEKSSTEIKATGRRKRKDAIIQQGEQPIAPKVELPQDSKSSNILEHTNLDRAKGPKKRAPAKKSLDDIDKLTNPATQTSTDPQNKELPKKTPVQPQRQPNTTNTNHLRDLINQNKQQETPEDIFSRLTTYLSETTNSQTIATRIQNIFVGKEDDMIVAVLTHQENAQTLKELAANTIYASEINELYRQYAHLLQ